ncbi:hypothetical protein SLEP1_g58579, partial [Rubroshorea leprosula]
VMERKNERLWGLLKECFDSGLITMYQMTKGFGRVAESLDDLALDVPDAEKQYLHYIERARESGWLDSSFCFSKSTQAASENGSSPVRAIWLDSMMHLLTDKYNQLTRGTYFFLHYTSISTLTIIPNQSIRKRNSCD